MANTCQTCRHTCVYTQKPQIRHKSSIITEIWAAKQVAGLGTHHMKRWVDDRKWHFCHHVMFRAKNLQLLKHNRGLWKEVRVGMPVRLKAPHLHRHSNYKCDPGQNHHWSEGWRSSRLWSLPCCLPQIGGVPNEKVHQRDIVCDSLQNNLTQPGETRKKNSLGSCILH